MFAGLTAARPVPGDDVIDRTSVLAVDPFLNRSLHFSVVNLAPLLFVLQQSQPRTHNLADAVANERLSSIKHQITAGTFSFIDEFPDYRYRRRMFGTAAGRTCNEVFDQYLAHCEARHALNDLAAVTLNSYWKLLENVWRPALGRMLFHQVRYSRLVCASDNPGWSKKTYNNVISVIRRAFEFGYYDHPERQNPAVALRVVRIKRKDQPMIDPCSIYDAETLIGAIHRDWGEAQGNYDEFRFFTGLRPSEQIALTLSDIDVERGVVSVNKACVAGIQKDCTKTREDRRVYLCPRAIQTLKAQLALRAELVSTGQVDHDYIFFFQPSGESIRFLNRAHARWRRTMQLSVNLRYRKPYCARHSSVSWNLMIGKNLLWVAKQHGHSVETMLRAYATWIEGNPPRGGRRNPSGDERSASASCSSVRRRQRLDAPTTDR